MVAEIPRFPVTGIATERETGYVVTGEVIVDWMTIPVAAAATMQYSAMVCARGESVVGR